MKQVTQWICTCLLLAILAGCAVPVAVPAAAGTPATTTEAATHTVTHALGESEVPTNPQRVVVLDTGELDNALALGASIIGAPIAEALQYQAYLADQLEGITDTGAISEPSLETILSLKPDLILGSKQRHEAIYEQLSAIAPTVFTESLRVPWQDNFTLHAEALDKSAEAEELLAAYAARTAAIKAALGDNAPTISIIRFRPGQVRLYLKSSYIGYILQDVGLPRPPAQDQDSFSAEISLEQVADIDADYIFITGYAQDDSDQDTFLKSELWTTLGAVQNGRAIDVDDDTWIAGLGVQSANLVLDDLTRILGLTVAEAPTASTTTTTAAPFPVTIEHKYGSTTITAKPERVVTVGLIDHDALLALGIVPVGTSEWFGGYPGSIWPWAQDELDALGGALPEAVGGESINIEKIASLQPDLILALYSGVKQEEYDLLSQIAPTVAQPSDYVDYGIPWQDLTLTVGAAVGQAAEAAALVAEVEALFTQVQTEHPEFTGATSIVATPWQGIWVYGEQDVRGRFLTMLGFQLPAGLQEVTGTEFGGTLSMERADLLDVDVIIWLDPETAEGELGGPVYQNLPVHTEGREVFLDSYNDPLGGATSFVSVLSLPFLLDGLVPQLADAMAKLK
ncbi:MAG: ABC transporter substrate-binding protein [Caldilineaceae bacterium]|nr:ABC transporter substrate-binding protein [Caldilineaceae bacterium]